QCAGETTLQTTVTGLPGGPFDIAGAGRLSGNGRYLLIYHNGSVGGSCAYVVDLQEPKVPPPQQCSHYGFGAIAAGRTVADEGTAITASGFLYFIRGAAFTADRVRTALTMEGDDRPRRVQPRLFPDYLAAPRTSHPFLLHTLPVALQTPPFPRSKHLPPIYHRRPPPCHVPLRRLRPPPDLHRL